MAESRPIGSGLPSKRSGAHALRNSGMFLGAPASRLPRPGGTAVGMLPKPIEELLDAALVGELTVIDERGRPITHPLIPLYDGERIYLTSSVLFSRKLEHIKANPKVSLSIRDPVAVNVGRLRRAP